MAEQATEQMVIAAPIERVAAAVMDLESYPRWAEDIKEVNVLERDQDGRPTLCSFRAAAFGRSTSYTLRYDYENLPTVVAWHQQSGDITTTLDGSYVFAPHAEGTSVTYHLEVELAVPIPGFIKMRVASRIIATALRELKALVERAQ